MYSKHRFVSPAFAGASFALILGALLYPSAAAAATAGDALDFTGHWAGFAALAVFGFAYLVVIGEEVLHLRKSKPVIVAAGIIWALVAIAYMQHGDTHTAGQAVRHNLVEFGELFLFLLAAMTYINTMDERGVFDALRVWLVTQGFSLRRIFWLTG
ncbi:MAG: sodium:proton antiporter NhaD, partial [Woeseia sp.]